jgi:hypothetical protein
MALNFSDSSSKSRYDLWLNLINYVSDEELEIMAMTALLEGDNIKRRTRARHGSIKDHAVVNKGKIEGHHRLYNDYLAENLVYIYIFFLRRF